MTTDMVGYPYAEPRYEEAPRGEHVPQQAQQHVPLHERVAFDEKRLQALELDMREVSQALQVLRAELGI